MIDSNVRNTTDSHENNGDENDAADEEISKSQRKREADAVRELGLRLTELGASELATIPVPEDALAAIKEYQRIRAHGARKRQLGWLAKRLRNADVEAIDSALEKIRQKARANTANLHLIENWRDRLLGDVANESAKEALTAFLDQHNTADRQQLRHLQSQALKERHIDRPPAAARALFKAIRDVISSDQDAGD